MLWISIERSSSQTLIRQVYAQVREQILNGSLLAGMQLPSTRALATQLQVSRNVILEAYDQLLAEGYIESRPGAGMYVTAGLHIEPEAPKTTLPWIFPGGKQNEDEEKQIDFRSGLPALDLFPRKQWGQIASRIYAEAAPSAFGYDNPEGRAELRVTLARYLWRTRGVRCHPEQLVILTGAAQAFSLLSKLLISPGDEIIVEHPMTFEVQLILSSYGAQLYPVPVDERGMQTELLPGAHQPRFLFVTPSHHFPIGGILPVTRRLQLLHFARETGCYLVEDDYDSEFRYQGSPISSLQGLEPERVIYIGTFSKILSPALRLGYLVLPKELITGSRAIKRLIDLHSPSLEQLILARFIEEGHLEKHIMRMKRVYQRRRGTLIGVLKKHFSDQVEILGDATGLHLVARFPDLVFTPEVISSIERQGVRVYPVETHAIHKGMHLHEIILGYSHLSNEKIEEGILRLKRALNHTL